MKRKIFTILALVVFSLVTLAACSSRPSKIGEFSNDTYVLSLNESIDLYSELEMKNGDKSDVRIVLSNSDILQADDNGNFVAQKSGETICFAQYEGKDFSSCKVIVKYQFSSPSNISVNEEGVVTWQESKVILSGSEVKAKSYRVLIANITDLTDMDYQELDFAEYETTENSYLLSEKGSYYIKIQALASEEDFVDASRLSSGTIINYGVMGILEDVAVTVQEEINNFSTIISWLEKPNASYDVYIEGYLMFENLSANQITYNFSSIENGEEVIIEVIAKDTTGSKLSSTTLLTLSVFDNIIVNYNSPNETDQDGYVSWDNLEDAERYLFTFINNEDFGSYSQIRSNEENVNQVFDGLPSGGYTMYVNTLGGAINGKYYLSSHVADGALVAKLNTPDASVIFDGSTAKVKIEEDEYNTKYKVSFADQVLYFNSNEFEVDLSGVSVGQHTLSVVAVPVEGKSLTINETEYTNILNSNPYNFEFYKLDDLSGITHNYYSQSGRSTFTVAEIANANYYELYINDEIVSDAILQIQNGAVYLTIDDLNSFYPQDDKYNIKIVAGVRDEDNVEHAIVSLQTKTLEVLPTVTQAQDQTNGFFKWNNLTSPYSENVEYYYEIFKTDSDYIVTSEPVQSGYSQAGVNDQELEFGYYVIRVYSYSTDTNRYLDSNFYNPDNSFVGYFYVTKQIDQPSAILVKEGDDYHLEISTVLYGGGYEIYVDGIIDGSVEVNTDSDTAIYRFSNNFQTAKNYSVKVVATSGSRYDGMLHLNSEAYELFIERLAQPQFDIDEIYDGAGTKINEYMTIELIDNAKSIVALVDGENVTLDKSRFDLYGYDNDFNVTLQYISEDGEGNQYYLNSTQRQINFDRVASPANISFDSGIVSWQTSDEKIQNYYITIILTNAQNGDYSYSYWKGDTINQFDLQEKIDDLLDSNLAFASHYRIADSVNVKIYSYCQAIDNGGDQFYISSHYGTTQNAQTELVLTTLEAPQLSFDSDSKTLSWNSVGQGSSYDILVDDRPVISNYSETSINLDQLAGVDWLVERKVVVKSVNAKYLDSQDSNIVYIKQLAPISSLNIIAQDGQYIAAFTFTSDLTNISGVLVNGQSENVSYIAGANGGYFVISDFESTINLQVLSQDILDHYYLDSQITTFNLHDIAESQFELTLSGDTLSWSELASDAIGQSANSIVYTIYVTNGERTYNFTTTENEYSIQDIEAQIGVILSQDVEIKVEANVLDYTLTLQNNQAVGYYGKAESNTTSTQKLEEVGKITYTISQDSSASSQLDAYLNSYVILQWQDKWSAFENVEFNIEINQEDETTSFTTAIAEGENYSLSLSDNSYSLTLRKGLLWAEEATVIIKVICSGNITSQQSQILIERFSDITNATVDNNGELNIDTSIFEDQELHFFMALTIGSASQVNYTFSSNDLPLNLNEDENLLKGKSGEYSIKIIVIDDESNTLPSLSAYEIRGRKLQGVENLSINENGNVEIRVFSEDQSNISFHAKTIIGSNEVTKLFTPSLQEGQTNIYEISMMDLLQLFFNELDGTLNYLRSQEYTFAITVSQTGSVTADWLSIDFNYQTESGAKIQRSSDYSQDFIVFDVLNQTESQDMTHTFSIEIIYQGEIIKIYKTAQETRGWWKKTSQNDNGAFTSTKGSDESEEITYSACYAINLSDILSEIEYGEVVINISRIGYQEDSNQYYQFSEFNFSLRKLNSVDQEITVTNNYLLWSWTSPSEYSEDSSFKPYSYYVVIDELLEEDQTSSVAKILVDSESLDLREIAQIAASTRYQISIIALPSSTDLSITAANSVLLDDYIYKYETPLSLEVTDGKLTFDSEKFEATFFMQEMIDYFKEVSPSSSGKTELYILSASNSYTSPFEFSATSFANQRVVLRFTSRNADGDTGVYYDVTVPAYQLLPEIEIYNNDADLTTVGNYSYFDLIDIYTNRSGRVIASSPEGGVATILYNNILNSNRGLSGDYLIFNDFGRSIPAGEYSVSIYQTSEENSNAYTIDSKLSDSVIMYVNTSPSVELQRNNRSAGESQGTKNYYEAKVTNVPIYTYDEDSQSYTLKPATGYTMLMRYNYEEGVRYYSNDQYLEFDIRYISGEWKIYYNNAEIEDIIHDSSEEGFVINFTNLRDNMPDNSLKANTSIRVDLYAYTSDSGNLIERPNLDEETEQVLYSSLNGKSASINLTFLDLSAQMIRFEEGELGITFDSQQNSQDSILVKYFTPGEGEQNRTIAIAESATVYIDFENGGSYDYIVLSINGTISSNTMRVESQSYAIANSYKLNTPTLSTSQNNLYVALTMNDINNFTNLKYMLGNDVALENGEGYYYSSERITGTYLLYNVGSNLERYPSEIDASQFYVFLLGNSGVFSIAQPEEGQNVGGADNILTFVGTDGSDRPVFSSQVASINAKMLATIQEDPFIANGGVSWEVAEEEMLQDGALVIYQVDISYYDLVMEGTSNEYQFKYTDTYYTTALSIDQSYIEDTYQYYIISVTALAGVQSDIISSGTITTIEGEYYNIAGAVSYSDGSQVLRGQKLSAGDSATNNFVTRTTAPTLLSGMSGISTGSIEFYISANVYNNNPSDTTTNIDEEKSESAQERISILASYSQNGHDYEIDLRGQFIFEVDTSAAATGLIKVTFLLEEGQLNISNSFNIEIRNYIDSKAVSLLMSNPLVIENVLKLPSLSEEYYQVVLAQDEYGIYYTYIDFTNYFNNVSILGDRSPYAIKITSNSINSQASSEVLITNESESKMFKLLEEYTSITLQAIDNQAETEANRKLLLNSDIKTFEIAATSVGTVEDRWIDISWDEDRSMFTWQWDEQHEESNNDSYQYYVTINIGGDVTREVVTNNYYMPAQGGQNIIILSFSIRARQLGQTDNDTIYIFSETLSYELDGGQISYSLFSGGRGTEESPYLISNAEQFLEIYKRNVEGSQIYYRLTQDIELGENFLISLAAGEIDFRAQTLYGNIDGQGHTLTLNANSFLETANTYDASSIFNNGIFNNYFALFESIDSSASISDLNVELSIDITNLDGTNLLITSLSLYNYGHIENVTVNATTINNLSGSTTSIQNAAFISGIVSVNYGTISNCVNNASFNFQMRQNLNIRFAYSAITSFNDRSLQSSGVIENCFNNGDVSLRVASQNNISYLSGITIVNSGTIRRSGNDGNFDVTALSSGISFTTYQTGITYLNSYGNIEYCYNNGQLLKSASNGTIHRAGIAITLTGGTINYLADTSGYALIVTVRGAVTDNGINYAVANSGTSTQIQTQTLREQAPIDAGDGYQFEIISVEGGFKAQII